MSHSVTKLTIFHAILFLGAVGGFSLLAYLYSEQYITRMIKQEIKADIHSLLENADNFSAQDQRHSIQHRLKINSIGAVYLFDDGQTLFGNLPQWPLNKPDAEGCVDIRTDTYPILAQIITVRGHYKILVGRKQDDYMEFRGELGKYLWIISGITILLAAFSGGVTSRILLGRVRSLNQVFDRLARGDFAVRAEEETGMAEFDLLARYINKALERNALLMDSMRQLSDRIAHELRRPLGALIKSIEMADDESPTVRVKQINDAKRKVDDILRMFDALLDVAEMEVGVGGNLELIDFSDCVDHAVELYGPMAIDKKITLEKDVTSLDVFGVFPLLVQLCANIVENALKYSPENTTILISLQGDKNNAVFSVEDQGGGVSPDLLPLIFSRFTRAKNTGHVKGHGLGLAHVKAITIRHGGRIEAYNQNKGLIVRIILPLAK